MTNIIKTKADDGSSVEFNYENPAVGGVKEVYFHPQRQYAVAFYKTALNTQQVERLGAIVGTYREQLYGGEGGSYWQKNVLNCWPEKIIRYEGKIGFVMPVYPQCYFFNNPPKGICKADKIVSAFMNVSELTDRGMTDYFDNLSIDERGDLRGYMQACLELARGIRRLNASGLAHSDLSCNNCLINPDSLNGSACIIDIDGLVVPIYPFPDSDGAYKYKYSPDVLGTHGYMAPEIEKVHKKIANRSTDLHSLAVLIYILLFHRHPLFNGKIYVDVDDDGDYDALENARIMYGEKTLFVEHPTDKSSLCYAQQYRNQSWISPQQTPYTIHGPYLKNLFEQSLIDGLHNPQMRPTAGDWETALIRTRDLLVQCQNKNCPQGWYVVYDTEHPRCPYCGTRHLGVLPVLDLYKNDGTPEHRCLNVYNELSLRHWHSSNVFPGEKLLDSQRNPVGYFSFWKDNWVLVNQSLIGMKNLTTGKEIPVGQYVELADGLELLFSSAIGARRARVRFVNR